MIGPTAEHADIARAVGYEWTPEGLETLYLRSQVLLACREAGIHALTGLWEDLENLSGLKEFAVRGRQLGFRGMIAIHPSHVATVNEVFTPSAETVAFYEGMVAAYEEAAAARHGCPALPRAAHRQGPLRQGRRVAGACGPAARDRGGDAVTETSRLFRGLYFEEFEVGAHYRHALTRTVTEMDNVLFTSLTMNVQPLHLDEEFSKGTIHGQRVVNSLFTVALIGAFHVPELTMGTTLGQPRVRLDQVPPPRLPRRHAARRDDDRQEARVRPAGPTRGSSGSSTSGINQRDEVVVDMVRVGLMARRPTTEPETPSPQGDQDS